MAHPRPGRARGAVGPAAAVEGPLTPGAGGRLPAAVPNTAHIESLIEGRNNQAYAESVELLGEVETLFADAAAVTGFADYVADVRGRHKPKRNLMKLDSRGW